MGEVWECLDALLQSTVREEVFDGNEYGLYSSGYWLLSSYGTVDGESHSPSSGRYVCSFCTLRSELIHPIDET